MIRIAINAGMLRGLGSAYVGQFLIDHIAAQPDTEITAWVSSAWDSWAPSSTAATTQSVQPALWRKLVLDQITLRRELRAGSWDALLTLGDTGTVIKDFPHVLFVQQLYLAVNLRELEFSVPKSLRRRFVALQKYFSLCMGSVSSFVVQTNYMKEQLVATWDIADSRISVIPSAVHPIYYLPPGPRRAKNPPYVFYPAGHGPHKNHMILPSILAALRDAGTPVICKLTVVPKEVPRMMAEARRLKVANLFVFLNRISHLQVREEMLGSVAVLLPSQLESFGLSYLEAMAAGAPIVCAEQPVAREQCGDSAAIYCPPLDSAAFAAAIHQLLVDPPNSEKLSVLGRRRFELIHRSWDSIAAEYRRVLESTVRL